MLVAGSLVAAAGSLLFALAPVWEVAAAGRTLVGVGVSVAFIAILKVNAAWFAPERFATMTGITMFAGNLGAVIAGAPLAFAVGHMSWRTVFVALAALSAAIAWLCWRFVHDRPEQAGFAAQGGTPGVSAVAPAPGRWTQALAGVLANPATWPGLLVNAGIGGSYLAFAGLWAVPYLEQVHGHSRVVAAEHASALLLGVAAGSVLIGVVSDRLRNRRGVMRVYAWLYAASWLPWIAHVQWPVGATLAWFALMGLVIPGFTLCWTVAKEVNRPEHSGIATAVVNLGIFLGTGILQPVVGLVLDRARASGDLAGGWDAALWLMAGAAGAGAAMTLLVPAPRRGVA
jgi:predicted MFS family arabinose efflux permease